MEYEPINEWLNTEIKTAQDLVRTGNPVTRKAAQDFLDQAAKVIALFDLEVA